MEVYIMEFTIAMEKSILNKEVNLTTKGVVYPRAQVLRVTHTDISFMYNGRTNKVNKKDVINITPYIETLRKAGLVR